jgi:hypothetical protein
MLTTALTVCGASLLLPTFYSFFLRLVGSFPLYFVYRLPFVCGRVPAAVTALSIWKNSDGL